MISGHFRNPEKLEVIWGRRTPVAIKSGINESVAIMGWSIRIPFSIPQDCYHGMFPVAAAIRMACFFCLRAWKMKRKSATEMYKSNGMCLGKYLKSNLKLEIWLRNLISSWNHPQLPWKNPQFLWLQWITVAHPIQATEILKAPTHSSTWQQGLSAVHRGIILWKIKDENKQTMVWKHQSIKHIQLFGLINAIVSTTSNFFGGLIVIS